MRPAPSPRNAKARPPGREGCGGPIPVDLDLREQLEERIRFERLLADLSANVVNVPADLVDAQIERALERLVDFLGIERSSFVQVSEDQKAMLVTHSYVVSGYPP